MRSVSGMAMVLKLLVVIAFITHVTESVTRESTSNKSCPTWLYRSDDGWCTCGSSLLNVIICSNASQEVGIQNSFCLTSFNPNQDTKQPVAGRCLYAQNHGRYLDGNIGLFVEVDQNITKQDRQLCSYLNREGRLCGACKHNHFVSPYSYDLKCYQCHRGLLSNTILYLTVAYVPLTIFLVVVVVFHISVTSPRLNVAILICQIYALPPGLQVLTQGTRDTHNFLYVQFVATVYGIWNLDFFRSLIPPICLPLNTLQVIALDYLVAVYPLLLLVCVYVLVRAHDRGCRLVVRLWRPFLWCSARIRQQWNVRNSIIDAFATFLLLSYLKFISTSGNLIIATRIFDIHGSRIGYFMYYNATVEFMGHQHMPFFIIAITVLLIALFFPLLLILYPMKWFQVFLNKCHLNSSGLRMFVECFQGYYRDRTDGGWECRYFSAFYPTLRIVGAILYATTRSDILFPFVMLILLGAMLIILVVSPYKKQFGIYNKQDIILLASPVALSTSFSISLFFFDWDETGSALGFVLGGMFSLVPLFYLIALFFKRMAHTLKLRQFAQQLKPTIRSVLHSKTQNRGDYEELTESQELIQ